MKKFSRLLSMILVVAMILCATAVVAFAEDPTFMIDTAEFSGYVGDSTMVWSWLSDSSALTEDVVWTSTDTNVATVVGVNEYGFIGSVELVGEGSCTVTATYKGQTASMLVNADTYDALPFNTEYAIADDGSGFMMQFTAPAAGYYTFMVTETDYEVYCYVNSMMSSGEFGIDADNEPIYAPIYLEANEVALLNGSAYSMDPSFTGANYKLKVVASPAATGYVLSESEIVMDYFNDAIRDMAMVQLLADPATAPTLTDCLWQIADDTIATIGYYEDECYLTPVKVGSTTLTVSKADGTPIQTIPVVVKDVSDGVTEMNWGVLYDFDPEKNYNLFSFTADKADTYTLESTFPEGSDADPFVNVYVKDGEDWVFVDYYDDFDYTTLNFKVELTATAGAEYLLHLGNWAETDYTFSIKGTDASDPGYKPVKVDAKKPTCTEDGNIEHYKCSVTGLLFTDETATRLAGDVVVKATGHKLDKVAATKDTIAHEKCSVCGALFVDGKEVSSVDNPETADNAMLVPFMALAVLSISGLAVTVMGKKKAF